MTAPTHHSFIWLPPQSLLKLQQHAEFQKWESYFCCMQLWERLPCSSRFGKGTVSITHFFLGFQRCTFLSWAEAVSVRKARMMQRWENLQYRENFEQGKTMLVIIPVDHNLCLLRKINVRWHIECKSANFIESYSTLTGAMGTGCSVLSTPGLFCLQSELVHKAKPAKGSAGKGSEQTSKILPPWKPACSERKT